MSLLPILENGLFALGQVLRFPIMILLWVCVAASLFMAGHAAVELVARQRERRGFDIKRWLQSGAVLDATDARLAELPALLRRLSADVQDGRRAGALDHGGLEHLLLEREEQVRHTLLAPRALVKVGPSIGLIGTLIPMGASLASPGHRQPRGDGRPDGRCLHEHDRGSHHRHARVRDRVDPTGLGHRGH